MADSSPQTPTTPPVVPPAKPASVLVSKPLAIVHALLLIATIAVGGFAIYQHFHGQPDPTPTPGPGPEPDPTPQPIPPKPPEPPAPPPTPPAPETGPVAKVSGLFFPLPTNGTKGTPTVPLGLIRVTAQESTSSKPIRWKVKGPAPLPLTIFSPDGGLGSSIAEAYPTVPGTYRIHGIARGMVKGEADADIDTYEVEVGAPDPPKPPDPGPGPGPGPNPPPPPDPPKPVDPSPFKEQGLRVLIVFESSEASKYPKDQYNTIYGQDFYAYLSSKCPKNAAGTPEYRIYDKDVNTAGESQTWQDAMKLPHPALPWIIIGNGTTGTQQELPKTKAEIMALIAKYEVPAK